MRLCAGTVDKGPGTQSSRSWLPQGASLFTPSIRRPRAPRVGVSHLRLVLIEEQPLRLGAPGHPVGDPCTFQYINHGSGECPERLVL